MWVIEHCKFWGQKFDRCNGYFIIKFKNIATLNLNAHVSTPVTMVWHMMRSSNGNIFRVTGHLCGEFTGPRWIPHTKASDAELWCFFICTRINGWIYNGEAGDLRRYRAHHDVTVMMWNGASGMLIYIFDRSWLLSYAMIWLNLDPEIQVTIRHLGLDGFV